MNRTFGIRGTTPTSPPNLVLVKQPDPPAQPEERTDRSRLLRERVLKGIEARQNSFLVREDIKSAFTLSYTMTCKALGKDRPKTGS